MQQFSPFSVTMARSLSPRIMILLCFVMSAIEIASATAALPAIPEHLRPIFKPLDKDINKDPKDAHKDQKDNDVHKEKKVKCPPGNPNCTDPLEGRAFLDDLSSLFSKVVGAVTAAPINTDASSPAPSTTAAPATPSPNNPGSSGNPPNNNGGPFNGFPPGRPGNNGGPIFFPPGNRPNNQPPNNNGPPRFPPPGNNNNIGPVANSPVLPSDAVRALSNAGPILNDLLGNFKDVLSSILTAFVSFGGMVGSNFFKPLIQIAVTVISAILGVSPPTL